MTFKYFNVKNGLTTGEIALHSSNGNVVASTFVGSLDVTGTANLGNVSNLVITGGTANYVLTTDGAGNLSWTAPAASGNGVSAISDNFTGNGVQTTFALSTEPSNINLTFVNYNGALLLREDYTIEGSNIIFDTPPGNGYYIEVTTIEGSGGGGGGGGSGSSISNGNSNVNIATANGNITFSASGNANVAVITGNGLVVNRLSNLGPVGNVTITGGTNGQVLTTNGSGGLSWTSVGTGSSISNGNSNVNIATADGNVTISAGGAANELVITSTGVNVAGTFQVSGVSNLGPASNLIITGGSNGYVLGTDGAGNVSWVEQSGGGGGVTQAKSIVLGMIFN